MVRTERSRKSITVNQLAFEYYRNNLRSVEKLLALVKSLGVLKGLMCFCEPTIRTLSRTSCYAPQWRRFSNGGEMGKNALLGAGDCSRLTTVLTVHILLKHRKM